MNLGKYFRVLFVLLSLLPPTSTPPPLSQSPPFSFFIPLPLFSFPSLPMCFLSLFVIYFCNFKFIPINNFWVIFTNICLFNLLLFFWIRTHVIFINCIKSNQTKRSEKALNEPEYFSSQFFLFTTSTEILLNKLR